MTYEEYKNNKSDNKTNKNYLKIFLNKLFTIIVFSMIIIIISNNSPKFKSFLVNDVLNNTMDFSKINKIINNFTSIFKIENTLNVRGVVEEKSEKYLDGVKYKISKGEKIYIKDSGIVTYIGYKEGYNNTIIIQQSNGYYAWYGNIKESVKIYDYLESGSELGTADDEYYYVLYKDNKVVDLSEN